MVYVDLVKQYTILYLSLIFIHLWKINIYKTYCDSNDRGKT